MKAHIHQSHHLIIGMSNVARARTACNVSSERERLPAGLEFLEGGDDFDGGGFGDGCVVEREAGEGVGGLGGDGSDAAEPNSCFWVLRCRRARARPLQRSGHERTYRKRARR